MPPLLCLPLSSTESSISWISHEARSTSDQFNHDQYDVDLVEGMPYRVQVVGGRFGEEKVVAVTKVIQLLDVPDQ